MPFFPSLLLNVGHALDHLFLLIFATAVSAIALDFGVGRWEGADQSNGFVGKSLRQRSGG